MKKIEKIDLMVEGLVYVFLMDYILNLLGTISKNLDDSSDFHLPVEKWGQKNWLLRVVTKDVLGGVKGDQTKIILRHSCVSQNDKDVIYDSPY